MKYGGWLDEWLQLYINPAVKQRTYEKYRWHIVKYIAPILGNYDMTELSPIVLQKFAVSLTQKGLSSNTVNGILSVLKASMKKAVSMRVVQEEWSGSVVRPKIKEKRIECFTKEEQRKIEQYILNSKKPKLFGIIIALYMGLRIGELLALTWEDIDFRKGILMVNKTCYDSWENGKYKKITDIPKTESSIRIIPLPRQLIVYLKDLKRKANSDYVVGGKTEYGAEVRSYQRTFEGLLKKLGIAHKGFHALRHTFATRHWK